MKPRTKRQERDESAHSDDMSLRAEQLGPFIGNEPENQPARKGLSPLTILEHVSRLCGEWAEADPIKTQKRQDVYGTWAHIWAVQGRGLFSINLNTGTVWRHSRNPSKKPLGNVADMIGDELVELLRR